MPLPIIHSYAGYQIYKLSLGKDEAKTWKMAALFMFLANLADLDMIPGMLIGNPEVFHRSITHSLGAAFVIALLVGAAAKKFKNFSFFKMFLVSLNAYFSHVALDYITGSVRFMLWPFKVAVKPLTITELFDYHHHHAIVKCTGLDQFCQMLLSPSLTIRLIAEMILVYAMIKMTRFFSKSRAIQPGISESPTFIAGLTLFIFVITALAVTSVAG